MWKQYIRNTLWFIGGAAISFFVSAVVLSAAIAPMVQACNHALGATSPWGQFK